MGVVVLVLVWGVRFEVLYWDLSCGFYGFCSIVGYMKKGRDGCIGSIVVRVYS